MVAWQAQLLRLTVFPKDEIADYDPPKWWSNVLSEQPEIINSQPKLRHYSIQSDYLLGKLILEAKPDRIDWLYVAPESENLDLRLGQFDSAIQSFKSITLKWFQFNSCPSVGRIAFGAILTSPAKDRLDAYESLDKLLPRVQVDANSSDFLYQINRPREIQLDSLHLKINRLSKWSASSIYQITSGTDQVQYASVLLGVSTRLELDINTSQESSISLNCKIQEDIFNELVQMGVEIATQGDQP